MITAPTREDAAEMQSNCGSLLCRIAGALIRIAGLLFELRGFYSNCGGLSSGAHRLAPHVRSSLASLPFETEASRFRSGAFGVEAH